MNLQPHACASPLPRVLFPHPMKPHNVMIILIPMVLKEDVFEKWGPHSTVASYCISNDDFKGIIRCPAEAV